MDMSLSELRELLIDREAWLQFMGSQRVGHDWETELNWTEPTKCVNKLFDFANMVPQNKISLVFKFAILLP